MAWSALFKAELAALSRSWVLRGWLIALVLAEFFGLTQAAFANRIVPAAASNILAVQLGMFLLVWSIVIIVLSAGSVSLEAEVISDSILSRACTRIQYITAKLTARAGTILLVYALSSGVAAMVAWRYAANDMAMSTMLGGIGVVALAVFMLVTMGIAMSVVFNNTVMAVAGMLLLWYVAGPIFAFAGAEYLSPASLVRALPRILKDPDSPQVTQAVATANSLTVSFSKPVDQASAETPGNYAIEDSQGAAYTATTALCDRAQTTVTLGGLALPSGESLKITVRNVVGKGGTALSPAADSATADVPREKAASATAKPAGSPAEAPPVAKAPATKPAASTPKKVLDRVLPRITGLTATASGARIQFSKEMDADKAQVSASYVVENPPGASPLPVPAATYVSTSRTVILGGLKLNLDEPVRVTVKDVTDRSGNELARAFRTATYSEVTLLKYGLGFGVPAVLFCLLATYLFSRRDL